MLQQREANKRNAIAFYRDAYLGEPAKAVDQTIEFVRAIAEGDLVAVHTHQTWPGNDEYVTMDFFRVDADGKIVAHWDAIQGVSEQTRNGNPMY